MGKAKKAKAKAAGQVKAGVAKKNKQGGAKRQRKSKGFGISSKAGAGAAVAAAYSKLLSSGEPQFSRMSRAGVIIRHRELVSSITGSTAFAVPTTLALNPGLAASFPWLSTQAAGWEQYRFKKLKFCYYTRTATSTPGSIMLVPDYDALDVAPVSEQVASAYRDVEEEVPWVEEFCCNLDPLAMHPDGNRKFVRTGTLPANADLRLSDVGNMFVCTTDGTAVNWGKLWVEYEVEFSVPQLPSGGSQAVGSLAGAGGSLAAATPFGAVPVSAGSFSLAAAATNVVSLSGLVIGQEYLLAASLTGTVVSVVTIGTLVGLTQKTAIAQTTYNSTNTMGAAQITVTATAPTASFVLSVTATTVTASQFVIAALTPAPSF